MLRTSMIALILLGGLGPSLGGCERKPTRIMAGPAVMRDYPGDDGALRATDPKCEDKDQGHKPAPGMNHCPAPTGEEKRDFPVLTGR